MAVREPSSAKPQRDLRSFFFAVFRVRGVSLDDRAAPAVRDATQKNLSMGAVVVQVLVPVVAVSVRLTRKVGEHKAAAGSSSQAKRDIDRLWRRVASGELTARQLEEEARTMQEDLYERRLRSPQVPDLIYRWRWRELEAKMKAAATEMVAEAQRAPPALLPEGDTSFQTVGRRSAVVR